GFVRVDRKCAVVAPAGVRDLIGASAQGTTVPTVHDVEDQRGVDADGRLQTLRRLPGAKANARHVLGFGAGGMQRHGAPIAGNDVTRVGQALDFDLQTLERGIDVAYGAAGKALFAQHVPRFE